MLLLLAPGIVLGSDGESWPLVLALLPLLLAWEHAYLRCWLKLHDAAPLVDERLESRIRTIIERSGMAATPELYQIGTPGMRHVNALALPSVNRPAIALGNALLDLFEPDEIAAIYAHELSHLEQFSPRVVRRFQFVTRVLILLSVGLPLLLRWPCAQRGGLAAVVLAGGCAGCAGATRATESAA